MNILLSEKSKTGYETQRKALQYLKDYVESNDIK